MSGSSYIKIASSDRINPGTTTPAQFTINSLLLFSGKYSLKAVYYPISFFNVNANNNLIYFTEGAVQKVATLPQGSYSISTLPAAVVTAMNTASGGTNTFAVAQSLLTGCLTITANAVPFSLTFGTNRSASAWQILGLAQQDTANNLVQTASNFPNLSPLRSLNININNIGGITDTQNTGQATFGVPILAGSPGGIGYWEPPDHFPQIIHFDSPTRVLQISVLDDEQKVVQLHAEWHMLVERLN